MKPVLSETLAADQVIDWNHSTVDELDARKFGPADLGSGALVTYDFLSWGNLFDPNNSDTERPLNSSEEARVRDYLQLIADVADITFVESIHTVSSPASLQFQARNETIGNAPPSFSARDGDADLQEPVAVTFAAPLPNSFSQRHALHEILHALGANHPGDYDGGRSNSNYDEDVHYFQDSNQYTIMSYWEGTRTGASYDRVGASTLQLHDVMAMQKLYGANTSAFDGDTVYGFWSNTDRRPWTMTSDNDHMFGAIWDTGGTDTINLEDSSDSARIDLREGRYSSTGGHTYNFAIAYGAVIENATGGSGDDWLSGNGVANRLVGGAGADTLVGRGGNDTLMGGANDDLFYGGNGRDSFYGDDGSDTVSYDYVSADLLIDLRDDLARRQSGGGEELLFSIENAVGGSGDDDMRGDDGDNLLQGEDGNDRLVGRQGRDVLEGGRGRDHLLGGVSIDELYGGDGRDVLDGGLGSDFINGGSGRDTVDYSAEQGRVIVDLRENSGRGYQNYLDDIRNVENIRGSAHDDTLRGDGLANTVWGGDGEDEILGRGGADLQFGNLGADRLYGGDGADRQFGGDDADTVFGGRGPDLMRGGAGDDTLIGGLGDDDLRGGTGSDWVDYSGTAGPWGVDLAAGTATRGDQTDTLTGIENIRGSQGDDTLLGDAEANRIEGRGGNDVIGGRSGDDSLTGGFGNDRISGGLGDDLISGGAGFDRMDGGRGRDTVDFSHASSGWTLDLREELATRANWGSERIANFENAIGGQGADLIRGSDGDNTLWGEDGNDHIIGYQGNDRLFGGLGDDTLVGHDGDDIIQGGGGIDIMAGGLGIDTVDYRDQNFGWTIDLGASEARFGRTTVEVIRAFENAYGGGGDDRIFGTDGVNLLAGLGGTDRLYGGEDDDRLRGGGDGDWLYGGDGEDVISGDAGRDWLFGDAGDDDLYGGSGNDRLIGGAGSDDLVGGTGADLFLFLDATDSQGLDADYIRAGGNGAPAFEFGQDIISLAGIDANTTVAGDQAFVLGSAGVAGSLTIGQTLIGYTVIRGYTDNDSTADFTLYIADGDIMPSSYDAQDFIL